MKTFIKDLSNAVMTMVIVSILLFCAIYFVQGELKAEIVKVYLIYNFSYGVPLGLAHGYLFRYLNQIYPWKTNKKLRLSTGILGSIIITLLIVFCINMILWVFIWGAPFSNLFSERNIIFYVIAVIVSLILSCIGHAISFYKDLRKQEVKEEKLRKEKLKTELNLLNSQIDPHFLFNSFNVLHGLIEEDPAKAQMLLTKLSGIYRYILENKDTNTNTIKAEIAFGNKYIEMQKARFENSIKLHIDVNESLLDGEIPSLALQILLENVIKHNAFDEENPISIFITTDDKNLIISNSLNKRTSVVESNQIGQVNIQDRYRLLSDETMEIEEGGTMYTVKLPILNI